MCPYVWSTCGCIGNSSTLVPGRQNTKFESPAAQHNRCKCVCVMLLSWDSLHRYKQQVVLIQSFSEAAVGIYAKHMRVSTEATYFNSDRARAVRLVVKEAWLCGYVCVWGRGCVAVCVCVRVWLSGCEWEWGVSSESVWACVGDDRTGWQEASSAPCAQTHLLHARQSPTRLSGTWLLDQECWEWSEIIKRTTKIKKQTGQKCRWGWKAITTKVRNRLFDFAHR